MSVFLISSLPGKAFRSLDLTCVLKAEPGKLDTKRPKPGILFSLVHKTSDYDVIFDLC